MRTLGFFALTLAVLASTAPKADASPIPFDQTYYFFDAGPSPTCTGCGNNGIWIHIDDVGPGAFSLTSVTASELTNAAFQSGNPAFSADNCLGYLSNGNCVEYTVIPSRSVDPSLDNIKVTVAWLSNTDSITMFPFLIQAEGIDPYTSTLGNPQVTNGGGTGGIPFGTCEDCDGAISGTTDNFSRFLVAYQPLSSVPVPEPGTLILLTTGLWTAARARRRR